MKTLIARKAQQSGFTLVELMIVVAIIGILASIAIPNYQKYQAKSRTSEGKIQLAAAYTAQKSFFIEYSSYTGCLGAAGYAPDLGSTVANQALRYYATGMTSGSITAASCGNNAATGCNNTWGNGNPTCLATQDGSTSGTPPAIANGAYWTANKVAYATGGLGAGQTNLPTTTVSSTNFTLGAAGNVNPSTNTSYDQWSINDGKVVTQVNVGY